MGAYYLTLNRNKESVCIDLKSDAGKAVFFDLVRQADVVFDNFSVGVPQRLGIDHATLAGGQPAHHHLLGHRLRRDRPRHAAPRLRPGGAGHGRRHVDHRHARDRPDAQRHPDRRPGRRHVRRHGRAGRARRARAHRRGPARGRLDARRADLAAQLHGDDAPDVGPRARAASATAHFVHVPYNSYPTADGHVIVACIGDPFFERFVEFMPICRAAQARVPASSRCATPPSERSTR